MSRHRTDVCTQHWIIHHLDRQKYHISTVKHRYRINRYSITHTKPPHIIACCTRDIDKILLPTCKYKTIISINRWTCLATRQTFWPIKKDWEIMIELYPSLRFRCIDDPDYHDCNCSVWTRTATGSDSLEGLFTLPWFASNFFQIPQYRVFHFPINHTRLQLYQAYGSITRR